MSGTSNLGIPLTRPSKRTYHVVHMPHGTQTVSTTAGCWNRMRCLVVEQTDSTDLLRFAEKGMRHECNRLLEEGTINVNTEDKTTKQTALHYAVACGNSEVVELLLNYDAECNIQDIFGNTPLHLAINKDHHICCKKILECGSVQINLPNKTHNTPLHLAVTKCSNPYFLEIVDEMLKLNADYNAQDSLGNTPLHLAAVKGYLDCCRKLLQWKGVRTDVQNYDHNTPLHLAAKQGNSEIIELLQSHHANCNAPNSLGDTPLHLAVTGNHLSCFKRIMDCDTLNINLTNKYGLTPLHCAAKTGNPEIVEQLLSCGASCNAQDNVGDTPLHLAVTKGHYGCCEKLLVHSDLKVNEKNKAHEAPLHQAALVGRRDVCDLILQYSGSDINIKNKQHRTPLHLAAHKNNEEVVELLLNKGADWKLRDKHAYMPLHYAAENGSEKSCEYLVKAFKEDKNAGNLKLTLRDKKTPLMLAAKGGYHRCCEKLLFQNINDVDHNGNTALFYATEHGFLNTISFLIQNGANINIVNEAGSTILHQAAKKRADDCLSYLLKMPDVQKLLSVEDNEHKFTPLHEAINNEALACAKILLNHKASTMARCKEGMTPLHLAAKQGDPGLCSLLVTCDKVQVNMINKDQQTPLHVAAMYGSRDACKVLLMTKGIQVLATDKDGRTALHLAADRGQDRVVRLLVKKGLSPYAKDDYGSTALHMAASKGHLKCCQILVTIPRHLIRDMDQKEMLPVDLAFENKHDEVFAFLIRELRPHREDVQNAVLKRRNISKNCEWGSRFHKYMHQSLHVEEPRVTAAEAIIDSDWWRAAFFPWEKDQYCTSFHELVKNHPSLALRIQNRCFQSNSEKCDAEYDFRLFEDIVCREAEQTIPGRQGVLTHSQRLLQEHPLRLMAQHNRAELLQHPLTEAWLLHLWKTCLSSIIILLLMLEVLFLSSLTIFMGHTHTWAHIEYKCIITQQQCCALASLSPEKLGIGSNATEATQIGRILPEDIIGNFGKCYMSMSSNFEEWLFLLIMMVITVLLECIYMYRLRAEYVNKKRLLKVSQVFFTIILLPPIGICRFHYQIWVWTTWQWHCGIIALLLEWVLFIQKLNQLPVLFVFMPVTKHFIWNYLKALGYILLLLFAFAYIFHLLLGDQAAFESLSQAMMKMIVWLLGDLNYDNTFIDNHLLYPNMGRLLLVVFIMVIGGYIANLAITQPSERLDAFRKGAAFFQMESQSILFLETMVCFPQLWKFNIKFLTSSKNSEHNFGERFAKKMMKMDIVHEQSLPEDNTLQNLERQVATLVNLCTEQAEELKDLKDKLNILFRRIPEPTPSS